MFMIFYFVYLWNYIKLFNKKPARTKIENCNEPTYTSIYDTIILFDIDDTIINNRTECIQLGKKAVEIVTNSNKSDIGIVTARPVWPPDDDLRMFKYKLPDRDKMFICYRPLFSNKSVPRMKYTQISHIAKQFKQVFFFDDKQYNVDEANKIENVDAYLVTRCNILELVTETLNKI